MEEAKESPHSQLTDDQVMIRTLVAMSLPAIAAILAMGTQATYNILVAVITALVCHYVLQAIDLKSRWALGESTYSSPYSPLVAGLIVGLCMGELCDGGLFTPLAETWPINGPSYQIKDKLATTEPLEDHNHHAQKKEELQR